MTNRHSCVRDAKSLLIEVRAALSGKANTVLIEKLDEAIRQLTEIENNDHIDPARVADILRIIGDGLSFVSVIAELTR